MELEALEPPEFHARRPLRHVYRLLQTFAAVKRSPLPSSASCMPVESTHAPEWIHIFHVAAFETLCNAPSWNCSRIKRGAFLHDGGRISKIVGETNSDTSQRSKSMTASPVQRRFPVIRQSNRPSSSTLLASRQGRRPSPTSLVGRRVQHYSRQEQEREQERE